MFSSASLLLRLLTLALYLSLGPHLVHREQLPALLDHPDYLRVVHAQLPVPLRPDLFLRVEPHQPLLLAQALVVGLAVELLRDLGPLLFELFGQLEQPLFVLAGPPDVAQVRVQQIAPPIADLHVSPAVEVRRNRAPLLLLLLNQNTELHILVNLPPAPHDLGVHKLDPPLLAFVRVATVQAVCDLTPASGALNLNRSSEGFVFLVGPVSHVYLRSVPGGRLLLAFGFGFGLAVSGFLGGLAGFFELEELELELLDVQSAQSCEAHLIVLAEEFQLPVYTSGQSVPHHAAHLVDWDGLKQLAQHALLEAVLALPDSWRGLF